MSFLTIKGTAEIGIAVSIDPSLPAADFKLASKLSSSERGKK